MQTVTFRMDSKTSFYYNTGNYIQYSMISYNGKNILKKNVYISKSLCYIVDIKQHYKWIILQYLKVGNKKKKDAEKYFGS